MFTKRDMLRHREFRRVTTKWVCNAFMYMFYNVYSEFPYIYRRGEEELMYRETADL